MEENGIYIFAVLFHSHKGNIYHSFITILQNLSYLNFTDISSKIQRWLNRLWTFLNLIISDLINE